MIDSTAASLARPPLLIVPGINNSEPGHWQSLWQSDRPESVRLEVPDWDYPVLEDWLAAFDRAMDQCPIAPIVVAHSLGCILAVHWIELAGAAGRDRIRGVFLVAPPDPGSASFPVESPSFRVAPQGPLRRPCVVIASTNDPYGDIHHAGRLAETLDAGFVAVGALGHINLKSDIGPWPQGRDLLECFAAGLGVRL
jgi:uncharacterized protein